MTEVQKVGGNKQLVLTLSLGYILIGLIVTYFYFFPTLINPLFSDILIVLGVLLLLSCLVFASIRAKSARDVALVLLGIILLSIVARSIPHLRLPYPPLVDSYYYAISALNIIEYGTLQPILSGWYSGVNVHLHWPAMHLFTAGAVKITGIDSMWFFRFQEPLLGGVFALTVFALAKEVTKSNTTALLSAVFASTSAVAIYYQSEYHPQGFAVIFFVLFLYLHLKSRIAGRLSYNVLALVCLVIFLLSHHFSSLFVTLLAIAFIGLNHLVSILPQRIGRITQVAREVRVDYNLWTIVAVAGLAYHVMIYFSPLQSFIRRYVGSQLEPTARLVAVGVDVPIAVTLLGLAKWGIFLLGAFSVVRVIRNPRPHEFRLMVLLAPVLFAGFIGTYIVWAPVDRMILFYTPLISVFAAMAVHKSFTLNQFSFQKTQVIRATMVLIVGLLLTAGFFNGSHIPALYFKNSPVNNYYWYSNRLPKMDECKAAGEWSGVHIPDNSRIGTGWYMRTIPFFFGRRSLINVISPVRYRTASVDYIMFESNFTRRHEELKKLECEYDRDLSVIYNNGEVKIYKLP